MSKALKNKPKVIQSDNDQSQSDLPIIQPSKKKAAKKEKIVQKKKQVQEEPSSQEEETPVVKKKITAKQARKESVNSVASNKSKDKKKTKAKPVEPSSQQEEESQPKPIKKKVETKAATVAKSKKAKIVPKEPSSQQQSQEVEAPKKKTTVKTVAKKTTKVAKDESQEEQSEQVKPTKKVTKPAKKVVKPPSSEQQSEEPVAKVVSKKKKVTKVESEQEEEESQQKPIVKKKKKVVKPESESQQEEDPAPVKKVKPNTVKSAHKKSLSEADEIQKPKNGISAKNTSMQIEDEEGEFQICVQGLSFQAYENDVTELFEQCGDILHLNLLMRPDGKSKGMAFVKFNKKSAFNKALELNGSDHMGRTLKVEQSFGKPQNNNRQQNNNNVKPSSRPITNDAVITSPTLFIGGLSFTSTNESMREHFESVGPVVSIRIVTDKETQRPKGFGYVEFNDVETAKAAYGQLNGSNLDGRQIRLDGAQPRDRPQNNGGGNYRNGGGNSNRNFGGRNNGNSVVNLDQDDKNARKGTIGTFMGTKKAL